MNCTDSVPIPRSATTRRRCGQRTDQGGSHHLWVTSLARTVRLALLLAAALLGLAGCTPADEPPVQYAAGVGAGLGGDAVILVTRMDDTNRGRRYEITQISRDGRAWRDPDYQAVIPVPIETPDIVITLWSTETGPPPCVSNNGQLCPAYPEPEIEAAIEAARQADPSACAPGGRRCWRVVPGRLAIEESTDGGATWSDAWSVSGPQRERYAAVLATRVSSVDSYPAETLSRELTCTSVSVVPESQVVIAACGLVGFVSRDPTGAWTMLGFEGPPFDLRFLEAPTPGDILNTARIVLCGWLILFLGAETRARWPAWRRGEVSGGRWDEARMVAGLLPSMGSLLIMVIPGDPIASDSSIMVWLLSSCLNAGMLVWLVLYLVQRRGLPWSLLGLAAGAPAVAWLLHDRIVAGQVYATLGWIGIWSILLLALAASIVLGLRTPRPHRTGV